MKVSVVTLFPGMFDALTQHGITGRAARSGLIDIQCVNPRDYAENKHRSVDDRPYGGGPGMVMSPDPLVKAVNAAKEGIGEGDVRVIYLSPQGQRLTQAKAVEIAAWSSCILVAGRYEGVDERFVTQCVDEELSIGDYVVSGGELPAMVLLDTVIRLLPGALGDADSAVQDSFYEGLLDCPHYTRPECYGDAAVPSVLLSGDHRKIELWRKKQAISRTYQRRPDLFEQRYADLDDSCKREKALFDECREDTKGESEA